MNNDTNIAKRRVERSGDDFPSQLVALYKTLRDIQPKQTVTFDFSSTNWIHPLLALPIGVHIQSVGGNFIPSTSIGSYLDAICFPLGISNIDTLNQHSKSYIPIGVLKREADVNRERFESAFLQLLIQATGNIPGSQTAIRYPISELITNIFEHSKSDTGWILAQWYPNKNYLDLCIVDHGRGLAAAYQEELGLTLIDEDAIRKVLRGVSTKDDKERGFGVRTSKDVVCKAMGGSFTLISGNAAFLATDQKEKIVRMPQFNWQGTIIGYRIPRPKGYIDITPYLE